MCIFYLGYKGICDNDGAFKKKFKILAVIAILLYIMISIANFASFDGWVRVGQLFDAGIAAAGVIGLIESILITICYFLLIYLVYAVHTFEGSANSENKE